MSGPTRTQAELARELDLAERRAWDSLGRYKFREFAHWVSLWTHLNRIGGHKRPNPWRVLVETARARRPLVARPAAVPLLKDEAA